MPDPYPDDYFDGCTIGPQKFGKVSHKDICTDHDVDWWLERTAWGKIRADWRWSTRLIRRHLPNRLWFIPAALYAALGFIGLNTLGWIWWANK